MEYIKGTPRDQLSFFPTCLDELIDRDNSIRFIDVFVNALDLKKLGFDAKSPEGRRPYNPSDLLKLYIYGYMNKIRSSRDLEKECQRNIEVMWLMHNLKPDHNTIARFRKDNAKAIKRVFRQTVSLAKNFNLIGGLLIAGDSTKLRAQNSKKNNYNKKKIERHLEYIEKKLAEHEKALAKADGDSKDRINQEIEKHKKQKQKYTQIQQELKESGAPQISTSDPQSRHQIVRNNITEVCYTLQATTDALYNIPIDYNVTNQNDKKAMGSMLRRAKSILKNNSFTALYDKGYHTGSEFAIANQLGIETLVAIPAISRNSQAPNPAYNVEHFTYDKEKDCYLCPEKQVLTSNGTWYKTANYKFRQFKTKACYTCVAKEKCTASKRNGKIVQRSQYTEAIEQNKKRVSQNQQTYKKRQAIVEHPFGTIKRQWGFDHVLTKKGINRASADIGFMMIAYNLKRIINLIGINQLIKALKRFLSQLFVSIRLQKAKYKTQKETFIHKMNFTKNEILSVFSNKHQLYSIFNHYF